MKGIGEIMEISKFFSKVFMWMFIGLAITFCTGSLIANNPKALETVFSTGGYWMIVIAELVLVIVLSARIHKMSPIAAKISFVAYSVLSGLTFSSIFIVYQIESIMLVFLIAAAIFFVLAMIGYFTKLDITKIGTILFISLIAIVVLSLVNMFLLSSSLDLGLCILGLVVFMAYVCYDVHRLKIYYSNGIANDNMIIFGALELYLDFINIFLRLLRLFGKSRD